MFIFGLYNVAASKVVQSRPWCRLYCNSKPVADLEGVQGVRSNPHPPEPNYFVFMGFKEILSEIRLTNPPFLHLNPLLKNPGSAPVSEELYM